MNQQRLIVYAMRNEALLCEDPRRMILETLENAAQFKAETCLNEDEFGNVRALDLLQWVNNTFPTGWSEEDANFASKTPAEAAEFIVAKIRDMYTKKVEGERADRVDQMERSIILQAIDKLWQRHITDMDALREGVRLRAQGQRDPLVEYKREAYEIFEQLMRNIDFEVLNGLFRSTTSLSAFEDFLASLPASNAEEEDSDVTDILGNGDLLSVLREQMERIQRQHAAEAEELPTIPEPEEEPQELPFDQSASGSLAAPLSKPEKKLELPKRKRRFVNIKRAEGGDLTMSAPVASEAVEGETLGSVDSGSMTDALNGKPE